MILVLYAVCRLIKFVFFFLDKSEEYIKKRRGVQPLVHREYTKGD
jgi:uncharacterized membrane protein YsdA (DUF1294 family)